jgi:hypothetical protein
MSTAGILFLGILLSAISICFGGEMIEPTRTLQEVGKTWGGLAIFSEPPQLEVYLNGEKAGRTPLWMRQVETGPHTIKIADAETIVHIGKDEKLTLGFFKGSFVIRSEPKKRQPAAEKRIERPAARPYNGPPEEEEQKRDLTLWEKFVNGTLRHF